MNYRTKHNLETHMKIVNVIASTKFDSTLNIENLARKLPRSIYEPEIFSGLVHRSQDPKATFIMFASGKVSSIGTNSEKVSRNSLNAICFEIGKLVGKPLKLQPISTENIVATGDMGSKINVMRLSNELAEIQYNPNKFPAIVMPYKEANARIKLLIFASGKIVSVGGKREIDAKNSILETYDKLSKLKDILLK